MIITVTGSTGLIGKSLCDSLRAEEHTLTSIRRTKESTNEQSHNTIDSVLNQIPEQTDIFIHLAGAPVFGKRWSKKYKDEIYNSRIEYTRTIVNAIGRLDKKPSLFICASAVGYYGSSVDKECTESTPAGSDFLSEVCRAWEYEASKVEQYGVRRISLRTGVVLAPEGGALKNIVMPFKFFAGGTPGDGKQWFPWIHIEDVINIIKFVLCHKELYGAINLCSPNVITMKKLIYTIGKTLDRPSFLTIPGFVFKLLYGQGAAAILEGQRAVPKKLINSGYKFSYPDIETALKNLLGSN
jgi:uncharacterized protein (TIGR01777 family)